MFFLNIISVVRMLIYVRGKANTIPTLNPKNTQKAFLRQSFQSSLHTLRKRYPRTRDISRRLWDDLRRGMGKEEGATSEK